jgi:signal peptidase I
MPMRPDAPEPSKARADRSWSTRLAWLVLVAGVVAIAVRVSAATVVQIHGHGMAPTLLDGDTVLLVRGAWGLERGDVVVYDPTPISAPPPTPRARDRKDDPRGPSGDGRELPDARAEPRGRMRNTAVVDRDELDDNWKKVQARADGAAPDPLRVGRIVAMPGDRVTFHVDGSALGLMVEGQPVLHKPGEPVKIRPADAATEATARATAFETTGERRYPILVAATAGPPHWSGLGLPPEGDGPIETVAQGYLVLADNRDEGACCDSRVLGWIAEASIRGSVAARLAGDPTSTPELADGARGFLWNP